MKRLPESDSALVVRMDFFDQSAWNDIRTTMRAPVGEDGLVRDFPVP